MNGRLRRFLYNSLPLLGLIVVLLTASVFSPDIKVLPRKTTTIAERLFGKYDCGSAEFVLQVYLTINRNYYDPDAVGHERLLNAALAGLAREFRKKKIEYKPLVVWGDEISTEVEFKKEFNKARIVAEQNKMDEDWCALVAADAIASEVRDSHTEFVPPKFAELVARPNWAGVGVVVHKLDRDFWYFTRVYATGPAYDAGIRRFDRLIAIDEKRIEPDWNIEKVVRMVRGAENTDVKLTVTRQNKTLVFTIKRLLIDPPIFEEYFLRRGEKTFVHLTIHDFDRTIFSSASEFWDTVKFVNAEGVIIDLRGNPGGSPLVLLNLTSLFFRNNTLIASCKERNKKRRWFCASEDAREDVPVVVLVDDGSASASEIFSAALKEHGRAKIVGEKTAGAVSMGMTNDLPCGALLQTTVGQIFTSNGNDIEGIGVMPDIQIGLTKEDIVSGTDAQLEQAIKTLEEQLDQKR